MKKRFFAILVLVMSLVLVTSCHQETKKEKLETPTNVAVSEEGLVTWSQVKNANAYFVEISEENEKYNTTVDECKYQLKNLKNDCTITVVAKGDNYLDSDKSSAVSYVGTTSKEQEVLYKQLVENSIGQKPSDLTAEQEKVYDRANSYLKKAAKNAIVLGYNEETVQTIVTALGQSTSSPQALLTALITVLSTYSVDEVKMALYYGEIQLMVELYESYSYLIGSSSTTPDQSKATEITALDKIIVTLENNELDIIDHLCNILNVVKGLANDAKLKVMTLIPVLTEEIQNNQLTAETVYNLKNAVVEVLSANLFDVEDIQYLINLIPNFSAELKPVLEASTENAPRYLQMIIDVVNQILPTETVDITEEYAQLQGFYLNLLEGVGEISKEFIGQALSYYDNPVQMVTFIVASAIAKYAPEKIEIPAELADVVLYVANLLLGKYKVSGDGLTSISALIGLSDDEVKSVLVGVINVVNSLCNAVVDAAKDPNFVKVVTVASGCVIKSNVTFDGGYISQEDALNDRYFQCVFEEEHTTSFDELAWEKCQYEGVVEYVVTDTNAKVVTFKLEIYDMAYDETNKAIGAHYSVRVTEYTFENLQTLFTAVSLLSGKLDATCSSVTALVNAIIAVIPNIKLFEGISNEQVTAVLATLAKLEQGDLDALLGNLYKLIGLLVNFIGTLNINEVAALFALGDISPLLEDLPNFASEESVTVLHELIINVGDVLEKVEMFPFFNYENKEDFVNVFTEMIDSLLPLPTTPEE